MQNIIYLVQVNGLDALQDHLGLHEVFFFWQHMQLVIQEWQPQRVEWPPALSKHLNCAGITETTWLNWNWKTCAVSTLKLCLHREDLKFSIMPSKLSSWSSLKAAQEFLPINFPGENACSMYIAYLKKQCPRFIQVDQYSRVIRLLRNIDSCIFRGSQLQPCAGTVTPGVFFGLASEIQQIYMPGILSNHINESKNHSLTFFAYVPRCKKKMKRISFW